MKKIILTIFVLSITLIFSQEKIKWEVKNLSINNEYSNFGTSFYGDKVIFSSSSGEKFHLYSAIITEDDVTNKTLFFKTETNESNPTFTNDGKIMYFTKSMYGTENTVKSKKNKRKTLAIFKATLSENGTWENATPLPFNSKKYDVGHPALNPDNTKLYFSSNMPGTLGKSDIFVVDVLEDNMYSKPTNLGKPINSKGHELHPYVSKNNMLYFSSNGKTRLLLGGLDIYGKNLTDNSNKLEHLDAPINSKWDDFSYIYNSSIKQGYISSNRRGGKGEDDIYLFKESEFKEPKGCTQKLMGTVYINGTQKLIPNALVVLKNKEGHILETFNTNENAKFEFRIACNQSFKIETSKEKFRTNIIIAKSNKEEKSTLRKNVFLTTKQNEKTVKKIKSGEIGFNYNEAIIHKRFVFYLDKAIAEMNDNPKLKIKIESHTDSRAKDEYNMKLSEDRIFAITEYMARKGVSLRQIRGVAYGETKPINRCVNGVKCAEKEYLENRRTIYKLIE